MQGTPPPPGWPHHSNRELFPDPRRFGPPPPAPDPSADGRDDQGGQAYRGDNRNGKPSPPPGHGHGPGPMHGGPPPPMPPPRMMRAPPPIPTGGFFDSPMPMPDQKQEQQAEAVPEALQQQQQGQQQQEQQQQQQQYGQPPQHPRHGEFEWGHRVSPLAGNDVATEKAAWEHTHHSPMPPQDDPQIGGERGDNALRATVEQMRAELAALQGDIAARDSHIEHIKHKLELSTRENRVLHEQVETLQTRLGARVVNTSDNRRRGQLQQVSALHGKVEATLALIRDISTSAAH